MKTLNIIAVLLILLSLRWIDQAETIYLSYIFICFGFMFFGLSFVAWKLNKKF